MKTMLLLSAGALLWACCVAAQQKAPSFIGAAPGNVFLEGEPLAFTVADAPPGLSVAVVDYDGREVAQGQLNGNALTVPAQPRGYYELHWQAGDQKGHASFGVLAGRPDEPPPSGPLNVDSASAWLCSPQQWEPIAKMLRKAGIGWVRERLAWAEVAPAEGKLNWGKYDTVADALQKQGIREYQIFHDSPGWTHPGKETRCPDDLREVYRFCQAAAAHYQGKILAWEPWNEPDIGFFDQAGDKYSGIQKAAYLGLKAGNPEAQVLSCSLCRGRSGFSDSIFECGIADYLDIFNFHTYAPIQHYMDTLNSWVGMTKEYGIADRPIWLTEAGIGLPFTPGNEAKELTPDSERAQAQFVPRSFATSLAAGVDRHFFFVLPFYPEGIIQFGALHRDLSPRPSFIAIATAARLLGTGRYLGKLPGECEGYLFDNGERVVAVAWANEPKEAKIPVGVQRVRVADLLGREEDAEAPGGILSLKVGPAARYILNLQLAKEQMTGAGRPPGKLPKLQPPKVVLVGHFDTLQIDKDRNCVLLDTGDQVGYSVEVYNFDGKQPARGKVRLELPEGWQADRTEADVSLEPMGRQALAFKLTVKGSKTKTLAKVWVRGDFPGPKVAPCVSYAKADMQKVKPARTLDLKLNAADRWASNISGNGTMEIKPVPDGGVSLPIIFTAPGDRWCYPRVSFDANQDWRQYDGIRLEYRFDTDDKDTSARVQVIEAGGSSYLDAGWPATKEWRRVMVLFSDLAWGSFSASDPNGKLDLDQVRTLLFGCNTKLDKLTLEVRNVELVGYE